MSEQNSNDPKKQTLKEFKEDSQISFNEGGDYDAYHSEETESDWDKAEKELRQQKGEEPDPEEVVDYLRNH